ncbi:PREDICTED: opioid growth factor receptor-like [Nanorana parkeri]|uniref:opioid growth factor receptor-like n=1 Tax=Nanorana parkeri TaxID=125878 RepID=UPI000854276B|nr:PREDICTED: opioid growth factor receptor-like [Nanorana parkeri]
MARTRGLRRLFASFVFGLGDLIWMPGHNPRRRAPRDMQNYRHGYPDKSPKPNLLFYQNKIRFEPDGEYIDYIHERWCNEYETLEMNHNFIQWLFPLRERGVNWLATPLTLSEIELMKKDKKVMARILKSYKLMLGFYGIVLVDADTGMVARAEDNWEDRFYNLNNHTHNSLRITRILKCLGEMGYEKLQAPLVRFFLEETLCNGNLPNLKESALDYFMFTVKEKKERQKLVHFAWMNYEPQEMFIWGPVDKLRKFNPLPQDAESKWEPDVPGEVKVQIDSEVSGSL